jgi:hypothetical protein
MANWNFDPSQYNERDFAIIPAGDHRVRISEVVEKTFNSGNNGFEITLDVNGHNSKLWFYLVLDQRNPQQTNQRIGEFFNSFGISNTMLGSGKQWVGAVGAVRVKHEEYNGSQQAKVAYCIARSRQDKLAPWQGNANTSSAAPNMSFNGSDLPFGM